MSRQPLTHIRAEINRRDRRGGRTRGNEVDDILSPETKLAVISETRDQLSVVIEQPLRVDGRQMSHATVVI